MKQHHVSLKSLSLIAMISASASAVKSSQDLSVPTLKTSLDVNEDQYPTHRRLKMMRAQRVSGRGKMDYWLPRSGKKALVGEPGQVYLALMAQLEENALDPIEVASAWSIVQNSKGRRISAADADALRSALMAQPKAAPAPVDDAEIVVDDAEIPPVDMDDDTEILIDEPQMPFSPVDHHDDYTHDHHDDHHGYGYDEKLDPTHYTEDSEYHHHHNDPSKLFEDAEDPSDLFKDSSYDYSLPKMNSLDAEPTLNSEYSSDKKAPVSPFTTNSHSGSNDDCDDQESKEEDVNPTTTDSDCDHDEQVLSQTPDPAAPSAYEQVPAASGFDQVLSQTPEPVFGTDVSPTTTDYDCDHPGQVLSEPEFAAPSAYGQVPTASGVNGQVPATSGFDPVLSEPNFDFDPLQGMGGADTMASLPTPTHDHC